MYWRLNRILFPVENLGPGKRIALWVQGCSLFCDGCISQDLWEKTGGRNVDVAGIAAGIIRIAQNLDGITITGGEPFDQYNQLVAFCSFVKQKVKLDILVFSGYTLEQLFQKFPDKLFTRCIDFLIDGPYVKSIHDNRHLRGSKNQKMFTFDREKVDVKAVEVEVPQSGNVWSAEFDVNNNIVMSGIPAINDTKVLSEKMKESGISFGI